MNLYSKGIQERGQNRVTRKPESTDEKVPKHNNLSIFGNQDLFVQRGSPSARGEEPDRFIFSNHVGRDLRLSKNERGRQRSSSLCLNQIADAGVYTSDILVVHSDFTILVTTGATGGGRTRIFGRWSVLRTFNNRFGWKTSGNELFGSHGSHGAFDSSHLFDSFAGKKK
jgi:hypothetical protein